MRFSVFAVAGHRRLRWFCCTDRGFVGACRLYGSAVPGCPSLGRYGIRGPKPD